MNPYNGVKEFFDRLAEDWDNCPEEYHIRERLVRLMGLRRGSIIADIGCGTGVMFEHLLKTEPRGIIAVDVSERMLEKAKSLCADARISYINRDVLYAPLPQLDAAVIFNAYPHFLNKAALAVKLERHIKPRGMLIIAHSQCRAAINRLHEGMNECCRVPLRAAAREAEEFLPYFEPELIIDDAETYFIKLIRSDK